MKKKIIKILIIILVLVGLSYGAYNLYWFIRIKTAKIEVTLKDDLTLKFTEKAKVSDFITSINGKIKDDYIIDSTKVGKKKIEFKFVNDDKIPVKYSYEIEIIDDVEPVIWLGGTYRVKKGDKFDTNKILCGDNYDKRPNCYVTGDYDTEEEGSYPLTFIAEDSSGNVATQNFVLTVYEPPKENSNPKKETETPSEKKYTHFDKVYEKYKTNTNKVGIDISRWQGDIDFEKLKNAGVEFVIIRVGYTKGTDAEYELDPKFIQNIEGANKYDIPVGLYFYSYANSKEHAIRDAKWIIEQIKPYKVELPIAFDWEEWSSFNEYNISFFDLTSMAESFIDVLEKSGYKGMIYSSKSYLEYMWLPTEYDIWLAHYTEKTNYQGHYKFWQLCEDGKVDGINGTVDIDIMYE